MKLGLCVPYVRRDRSDSERSCGSPPRVMRESAPATSFKNQRRGRPVQRPRYDAYVRSFSIRPCQSLKSSATEPEVLAFGGRVGKESLGSLLTNVNPLVPPNDENGWLSEPGEGEFYPVKTLEETRTPGGECPSKILCRVTSPVGEF